MNEYELNNEVYEQFKIESRDNIKMAEDALLSLEKSTDSNEAIDELFRAIHTIKGSADYLGLNALKDLSHAFENVLDGLRKLHATSISLEQSNVFFEVLDLVSGLVSSAPADLENNRVIVAEFVEKLKELSGQDNLVDQSQVLKPQIGSHQNKTLKIFIDTVEQQIGVLQVAKSKLHSEILIDESLIKMIIRALNCISNACQYISEESLDTAATEFQTWVTYNAQSSNTQILEKKIENFLELINLTLKNISSVDDKVRVIESNEKNIVEKILNDQTVRVDQNVLDGLINLIGELIIARNTFSHIQSKLSGSDEDRMIALKEFRESSNLLAHITSDLQRNVMKMRMVPVKTIFKKYNRIVRDLTRKVDKTVELVFEGEETEIDKAVAEQISEPLIHLVRNAIDHGIESDEKRRAAGKSSHGTLIMKASHQGNYMVVEVIDDGAGIDIEKIKAKVLENGPLTTEQINRLSKNELLDYIFAPGFSTAKQVTDISGRGVGLDVVKTNLKKIKGNVSISSELNEGTCFRLEVPLTMAIMRALLVQSGQSIYAISLQDVSETVKVRYDELKSINQRPAISLRNEVIMVEWLGQLLKQSTITNILPETKLSILILNLNGEKFGLIVDSVYRQEEIVLKPLPDSYAGVPGLAGASILGDGRAILILDINQLYKIN